MDKELEDLVEEMVERIDKVIMDYDGRLAPHNVAGILLSRVTLLMTMDPATGKGLMQYVWEKLDEIEQANPGNML
jgi:hypothetical protein